MPEVHGSVKVGLAWHQKVRRRALRLAAAARPGRKAQRQPPAQVMAFSGVGVMIAVGYMCAPPLSA